MEADDELTPWEREFLSVPGEQRGYQPRGADAPGEPPEPPPGSAGASPVSDPAEQQPPADS